MLNRYDLTNYSGFLRVKYLHGVKRIKSNKLRSYNRSTEGQWLRGVSRQGVRDISALAQRHVRVPIHASTTPTLHPKCSYTPFDHTHNRIFRSLAKTIHIQSFYSKCVWWLNYRKELYM